MESKQSDSLFIIHYLNNLKKLGGVHDDEN